VTYYKTSKDRKRIYKRHGSVDFLVILLGLAMVIAAIKSAPWLLILLVVVLWCFWDRARKARSTSAGLKGN